VKKLNEFLNTAVQAALAAGAIQRERFGASHDIRFKGEADLVTEVDLACENAVKNVILEKWPHHALLGEEGGVNGSGDFLWIVDPLDGTTNYTHNYPHFCASVALQERGRVIVGAVYDPMRDELFTAKHGAGAFLNGKPIHPSNCSKLEQAMLVTGFPYDLDRRMKALPQFGAMLQRVQAIRRDGSAALNLCYVAAGRFDGFWEISLHAWDIAAGRLIIEEAGGKITGMDGNPTSIYSEQIVASNCLLHDEIVKNLFIQPS